MKKNFIICLIIISIFTTYFYGIERYLAITYFDKYLKAQGVRADIIENKTILKDWKMGGYKMIIYYSDNKDVEYEYSYSIYTHRANDIIRFNVVDLYISKDGYVLDSPYSSDIKYPPIKY